MRSKFNIIQTGQTEGKVGVSIVRAICGR